MSLKSVHFRGYIGQESLAHKANVMTGSACGCNIVVVKWASCHCSGNDSFVGSTPAWPAFQKVEFYDFCMVSWN